MMKRKNNNGGAEEIKRRRLVNSDDHALASSCSTNVSTGISKQKLPITDRQEVSSCGVEILATATQSVSCAFGKETTSLSDLHFKVIELDSTAAAAPPCIAGAKMPSDAELEEFFSAAQRKIQNQFSRKYNFDIVTEEPLEGRYEWVQVKP